MQPLAGGVTHADMRVAHTRRHVPGARRCARQPICCERSTSAICTPLTCPRPPPCGGGSNAAFARSTPAGCSDCLRDASHRVCRHGRRNGRSPADCGALALRRTGRGGGHMARRGGTARRWRAGHVRLDFTHSDRCGRMAVAGPRRAVPGTCGRVTSRRGGEWRPRSRRIFLQHIPPPHARRRTWRPQGRRATPAHLTRRGPAHTGAPATQGAGRSREVPYDEMLSVPDKTEAAEYLLPLHQPGRRHGHRPHPRDPVGRDAGVDAGNPRGAVGHRYAEGSGPSVRS